MTSYIRVAVNIPQISGVFDYHLPEALAGRVKPGCLVTVPFGRQVVQGIVLAPVDEPEVLETRAVDGLLDPEPVLTPHQMALAAEISETTLSPLSACLDLMLPPGLSRQADTLYRLAENPPEQKKPFSPLQERIIEKIRSRRGELRARQLDAAFRRQNWKAAAQALERSGVLISGPVLQPPGVRARVVRTVRLACAPQDALQKLEAIGRAGSSAQQRRRAILEFLAHETWPVEASWVYAASGGNLSDLQTLEEEGLVMLGESETWRDPLENLTPGLQEPPQLTRAQDEVWKAVWDHLLDTQPRPPILLQGVTGSGKTEIYLRAVAETLRQGKQALILVPEIALTPQTVQRFMARFPGQVGLAHSKLSAGERYDTWRRARAGLLPIIVGARSALFSPLPNPGLIVIDECHDDSYYQGELPPTYHAVRAALGYARITNCTLLMGTATPDVNLRYRAEKERWLVLHLPERILAHRERVSKQMEQMGKTAPALEVEGSGAFLPLPPVEVVDMRQELKAGNRSIFSRSLQTALREVLAASQQAILFLNRRGAATYIFCRDCGYVLRCPRCDLPLTLHLDDEKTGALLCHTCGYRRGLPVRCPQCSSQRIRQYGTGTEKVEEEVQALFPGVRTLRWDFSTTRARDSHEIILSHFSNHRADVLIGTQMLAKGLDLPLITLVGVVLADVGLSLPDYRAAERTFQVLTQVAGRAGRSPLGGRVVLQTFQPDQYPIQAAAAHDFDRFYRLELEKRRQIGYPPFSSLARMEYRHTDARQAEETARRMAEQVKNWISAGNFNSTEMIGPAPCFFGKVRGEYRWQIILRGPNPAAILRGQSLKDWQIEVDPASLL